MKKVILFLIASAFAISCSSDDSKSPDNASLIVGTWRPISIIREDTRENEATNVITDCQMENEKITFKQNKTILAIFSDTDGNGECYTVTQSGATWSVNGNILTVTYGQGISEQSVISFSNSNTTLTNKVRDGYFDITTIYSKVQ